MREDLTARLAALALERWKEDHEKCTWRRANISAPDDGCDGTWKACNYPKPAALVEWEQAQQAPGGHDLRYHDPPVNGWRVSCVRCGGQFCDDKAAAAFKCPDHGTELPNPRCACQTCNDLRADGPWREGAPAVEIRPSQPSSALAYVLTRNGTPIRWYLDEVRAKQDLSLVEAAASQSTKYELHAVPRVG